MKKRILIPFILVMIFIACFLGYQTILATTYTQPLYGSYELVPTADTTDNISSRDVIGNKSDAAAAGAVTTTESIMAYAKQGVGSQETTVSATLTTLTNGNNNLFVVAGGPVKILEITAYVTTIIESKSCLINYNIDPTTHAGDTAFGTDGTALEINGDAVGTLYTWDGVIANDLTATTNGVALGVAALSGLIVPAGSIELAAVVSTSATGAVTVYIRYIPLAIGATITAA